MKQKRKVKSLISSESGSDKLLTTLLFLIGGILVFGAVALFTSSVGIVSAEDEPDNLQYDNGIEDKVEILLNLKLAKDGLTETINEMYFSGDTFYMKSNTGIVRAELGGGSVDGYVNYLGGESDGMNIASDNVTVIGGKGLEVYENNPNATILGGKDNKIEQRTTAVAQAPVMLGGEGNTIGQDQIGSAIVGGKDNEIESNGSYDFILGGENNIIKNGKSNVIVGGAEVTVNQSNVFVFNDGETTFEPQSSNAFYLNLKNGLGLNKAAANKGVDSKGAVSLGSINITTSCEAQDVGVQGKWEGCLVGCTQASADSGHKWEMMDHGDTCEEKCKSNPTRCMVNPIEPTPPDDYTSECTVGGVDTSHSIQCAENRLGVYENVVFETFLIDSDEECEDYDDHQNKCIFKCEKDYHLTGNVAGGSSTTKKCYADCTLPWNGKKIKHNETVTGYNAKSVACSNTDWIFPVATAIVNVPYDSTFSSSNTRTLNNMLKMKESVGHSFESCTNYTHEKKLVCYDGELYIANTNGTKTSTKALGDTGAWYGYDVCETKDYKCPTGTYNLTQAYITSSAGANDTVTTWNNTDRSTSNGTRGQYELCLDWTPSVGNSECKVGRDGATGTPANSYHYQLVKCQAGYSTGTDNNPYECKKSCYLSGTSLEFKHNSAITGYKHDSRTCTDICDDEWIVCNDGQWRVGTKSGTPTTDYHYYNCILNDKVCASNFDVKQTEKDAGEAAWGAHSVYATACVPYSGNGKFQCDEKPKLYDLIGCDPYPGYHTENNKYCRDNDDEEWCRHVGATVTKNYHYIDKKVPIYWIDGGSYNNGSWSIAAACSWICNSDSHLEDGDCENDAKLVRCDDTNVPSTANTTWARVRVYWQPSSQDYTSADACEYTCKDGYEGDECGTACQDIECPSDEYPFTSATCPEHGICGSSCTPQSASDCSRGSSVVKLTSCVGGYHISSDGKSCDEDEDPCESYTLTSCPTGWICDECTNGKYKKTGCDTVNGYYMSGGSCVKDTIYCTQSGGPTNSHYINTDEPVAVAGNCDWDCDCGYYENSTATACLSCPSGQYSTAGSTSCSACPSGQQPNSTQCGCVPTSCTPSKTCASYSLSSSPSGDCYNTYTKSDGCTNSLTCYENGCSGTKDTCYYPDSSMPSDFASNSNFDITDFDHGICATNNCFPAGTKVTMADGSLKNIEDIVADDMVLSYNEITHKLESNRVLFSIVHENVDDEMYELTINGRVLKVTGAHRFYVKTFIDEEYQCVSSYDWVAAKDLKIGDMLFMKDGTYSVIESIVHYAIHDTVYNLSVENNHTYFVEEGYLVHNSKIDIPTCTSTTCSSLYSYSSCPSGKGCSSCTATNSDCTTTTKYKVDCTINECSGYGYTSCPEHGICSDCTPRDATCTQGDKKYALNSCESGYHISSDGKSCDEDEDPCEGYTLSTCPTGWLCDQCTNGKYKKNGCDTENGYTLHNGDCAVTCPAKGACPETQAGLECRAYPMSTSFCPDLCTQTTYTCGDDGNWNDPLGIRFSSDTCSLQGTATSCDTTEFPLTKKMVLHATSYSDCTSYTVSDDACVGSTRYRVTACEDGYSPSSDGKSCVSSGGGGGSCSWTCMDVDPYCKQTNSRTHCGGTYCSTTDYGQCTTRAVCKGINEPDTPANWLECAWAEVTDSTNQELCCSWITNEKEAVCMNGATSCNESDCTGTKPSCDKETFTP